MTNNVTLKLKDIVEDPVKFSETTPLVVLIALIKKANHSYYNTDKPIISDYIYDILLSSLNKRDPKNPLINSIGAPVTGEKIALPVHMGSMDKIKSIDGVKNWLVKYLGPKYLVSEKLDGTSCGVQIKNKEILLFSRGKGNEGRNITHLLKYLNIPKNLDHENLTVRGELIISKHHFKNFKDKVDARSVVNGLTIRKNITAEDMKYVEFVAYEIIYPENLLPFQQFMILKKLGFKTAQHQLVDINELSKLTNHVENSFIYNLLLQFKINSEYQIDGIIVTENKKYRRNISGNPKYSFAFKANDPGQKAKVIGVEWNISNMGF